MDKSSVEPSTKAISRKRIYLIKRVAERISEYNKMDFPVKNPVKQISSDYYIVNIREAIDANILKIIFK
ncbi:MAG: hypothetical protein CM15mP23_06320 [Cryomorphaceae bacterium]|nr:MAG: hypothetical protein CM15mP23_06320 [Cryomorphaceae bacterium]